MEIFALIFVLAFGVLLVVNFLLYKKVTGMRRRIKEMYEKMKTMSANIDYIQGIELDFSSLEEKVAEIE
jgi:hypothetical protein